MTYAQGGPAHVDFRSARAGDGHRPPLLPAADRQGSVVATRLAWLVALLGLTAYVVGYCAAPPVGGGWGVRFGTLAAVVAVVSIFSPSRPAANMVVTLAVMGFLESLWDAVAGGQDTGSAGVVIAVVAGLQAAAALTCLLAETGAAQPRLDDRPAAPPPYTDYSPPAPYYAATGHHPAPPQRPMQAQATGQATATGQTTAERDALYAEYLRVPPAGSSMGVSASAPSSDAGYRPNPVSGFGATPGSTESRWGSDAYGEPPTHAG